MDTIKYMLETEYDYLSKYTKASIRYMYSNHTFKMYMRRKDV